MRTCFFALAIACTDAWVFTGRPSAPIVLGLKSQQCSVDRAASVQRPMAPIMAERGPKASKKDVLELEGVVLEALPSATFRVQLDDTDQVSLTSHLLQDPVRAHVPHPFQLNVPC